MMFQFKNIPSDLDNLHLGFSDIEPLKHGINSAVARKQHIFTYKGEEVLVAYARYIVSQLEELAREYQ